MHQRNEVGMALFTEEFAFIHINMVYIYLGVGKNYYNVWKYWCVDLNEVSYRLVEKSERVTHGDLVTQLITDVRVIIFAVCMHVRMCVCMYVYIYVYMYVCMHAGQYFC